MKDSVLKEVGEKLARNEAARKEMNKVLGRMWAIGGSIVLLLIIALCAIAIFTKP